LRYNLAVELAITPRLMASGHFSLLSNNGEK